MNDFVRIQIKMQLSGELHGGRCEKGEKCVSMSVGWAQTLLKNVGGNRNLTDSKIFQRADLPKANHYGHKQVSPRDDVVSEKRSGRAGGTAGWWVQPGQGACPATGWAGDFWQGIALLLLSTFSSIPFFLS